MQAVFSIITVVFNGEKDIEGTLRSVERQTYRHFEHIVVDGASTDRTLEIVQKTAAREPQLRWISEKDRGLYDAMNKGLRLATGDFVCFLNCGDQIHAPDVLEKIAACADATTDVLYGETLLVNENRQPAGTMSELSTRSLPKNLHWRDYLRGMLVVHQSFIARRSLAPAYIENNLCADYDWCIEILKKSRKNVDCQVIICDYLMGGMSKQRHRQALRDRFRVMRKHFGLLPTLAAHGWIVLRAGLHFLKRWGRERY